MTNQNLTPNDVTKFLTSLHTNKDAGPSFKEFSDGWNIQSWKTAYVAVEKRNGGAAVCVMDEDDAPNLTHPDLKGVEQWDTVTYDFSDLDPDRISTLASLGASEHELSALARMATIATASLKKMWVVKDSTLAMVPIHTICHELWPNACHVFMVMEGDSLLSISIVNRELHGYGIAMAASAGRFKKHLSYVKP
jgi:hypothetical protein